MTLMFSKISICSPVSVVEPPGNLAEIICLLFIDSVVVIGKIMSQLVLIHLWTISTQVASIEFAQSISKYY